MRLEGVQAINLNEEAPWLLMFKHFTASRNTAAWSTGNIIIGWMPMKFAHKVAAIGAAAEGDDAMCWYVVIPNHDFRTGHDRVAGPALAALPATIAMIERAQKYPECGFMMFRLPQRGR